jgi:hypothetical protein
MVELAATLFVIIIGLYVVALMLYGAGALFEYLANETPVPRERFFHYSWFEKEILLYAGVGFGMLLVAALLENAGLIR